MFNSLICLLGKVEVIDSRHASNLILHRSKTDVHRKDAPTRAGVRNNNPPLAPSTHRHRWGESSGAGRRPALGCSKTRTPFPTTVAYTT